MKKAFGILIINVITLLLVFLAINAVFLWKDKKIDASHPFRMYVPYEKHLFYLFRDKKYIRKPAGMQYLGKKSIVLYGGSYSYGYLLPFEKSFGKILSDRTKRTVYNFSMSSRGIQHMLYFLEEENHFSQFSEPEFVIYTFIDDHVRRLYQPCNCNDNVEHIEYARFRGDLKKKNSVLKYLHSFYIYNKIQKYFFEKYSYEQNREKNFELVKEYFIKSKKCLEKHYPNAKFVILLYPSGEENIKNIYIEHVEWADLKKSGFEIYNVNELTHTDLRKSVYKSNDGMHPNEKAWELIVPYLSEKLQIK